MIRHIRWQVVLVALGLVLSALLLSRQAVGLEEVYVPSSGGTLIEGVVGWPQYLNPLLSWSNPVDRDICALIFEGLTRYDESGRLVPQLATGWHVSLDGLVYTFWLRQDVRWQDGTRFSADDVIFTLSLIQAPGFRGSSSLADLWRSVLVEKVDDYTVTFTLAEAFAPFVDYTTVGILPAHLLADVEWADLMRHSFNRAPVGTGRFRVQGSGWQNNRLLLVANSLYRGQRPQLAGIQFHFFTDHESLLDAFTRGEVHTVSSIQMTDMARAQRLADMNIFTSNIPRYTMVMLNLRDPTAPFLQDVSIRQALLHGIDRPRVIAEVIYGQGTVANSPLYPGSWAHLADVAEYPYDFGRAARLLDGQGWPLPERDNQGTMLPESELLPQGVRSRDGRELSFRLTAVRSTLHEALARTLVQAWDQLGIRVTVELIEPGELLPTLRNGGFQAILVDVDMTGDPDLYSFWSESAAEEGQNYGNWMDRRASQLLEEARQLSNVGQRTIRYYRFQQIFAEQVPALLLYHHTYSYGVSDQVQQVTMGPLTHAADRFATVGDWFLVWREVIIRSTKPEF